MASSERSTHLKDAPVLTFDLTQETEQLRGQSQWLQEDRNAITLIKNESICVVLIVMKRGARLVPHELNGFSTVQLLAGHIQVEAENVQYELRGHTMSSFESKLSHAITASEESTLLLTIVYPPPGDRISTVNQ